MKKGISLIVLVITVIVMIIIAGAIIITLTRTNIINQAEQGTEKFNEAIAYEQITQANVASMKPIQFDGKTYIRTDMTKIIDSIKANYDANRYTITATVDNVQVEQTNQEALDAYYLYTYNIALFEELESYVKTIPSLGLTQQQVIEYFEQKVNEYNRELLPKIEDDSLLVAYYYTRPGFEENFTKIMQGNPQYYTDCINRCKEAYLKIHITVKIMDEEKHHEINEEGKITDIEGYQINSEGIITGYIGTPQKNLVIPAVINGIQVKAIANYAFAGYEMSYNDLADMTLPVNIQFEGYNPDLDSPNLSKTNMQLIETIILPEGLLAIGKMSFIGLENLTSVEFPSSLKAIGLYFDDVNPVLATNPDPYNAIASPDNNNANKAGYTFCNCFKLTSVTIPNTCAVGMGAFANCKTLTTVNHTGFHTTGAQNSYMLTPYGG